MLDGGGHVPGDHLRGIVVHSQGHDEIGVIGAIVAPAADEGNAVGDHGGLPCMFQIVFRKGIAHQAPALNEAHPGNICEKMVFHFCILLDK